MTLLITGAAGFIGTAGCIGSAMCERLLARAEQVVGVDSLNAYYDPTLKQARLERLEAQAAASGSPSA
jgi:UDP-glucuronate 4-epimerase